MNFEARSSVLPYRIAAATIGLCLAAQISYVLFERPSILRPRWLESHYIALAVAAVALVMLAFVQSGPPKEGATQGLLLTGPPYGWYAIAVVLSWAGGGTGLPSHLIALLEAIVLAGSGAALGAGLFQAVMLIREARLK